MDEEIYRECGNLVCEKCRKKYYDHSFSEHLGFDGYPFLRRLCNGDS